MTSVPVLDVLVAGAGHAGLLLAGALADEGLAVAVVDPAPPDARPPQDDGRTLALMRGSREAMERLGAWEAVAVEAAAVRAAEVVDVGSGEKVAYRLTQPRDPPFAYGLRHAALRTALASWCRGRAVPVRRGRVVGIERDREVLRVHLDEGELATRLLVGADGRRSAVRELAGIGLDAWAYPQVALTFVVRHDRPHGDMVREYLRAAGPLALLPIGSARCGVTWVEPPEQAAALSALPPASLAARLDDAIGNALGELVVEGAVGRWPLGAQHARRYVAPRIALVGDAAHGVHPIHAQGFNMGVADVALLVELLAGGADPGDASALLAYERQRRAANRRRIWLTDGLARLFTAELPPLRAARGLGLRLLDGIAPLRDLAVWAGSRA